MMRSQTPRPERHIEVCGERHDITRLVRYQLSQDGHVGLHYDPLQDALQALADVVTKQNAVQEGLVKDLEKLKQTTLAVEKQAGVADVRIKDLMSQSQEVKLGVQLLTSKVNKELRQAAAHQRIEDASPKQSSAQAAADDPGKSQKSEAEEHPDRIPFTKDMAAKLEYVRRNWGEVEVMGSKLKRALEAMDSIAEASRHWGEKIDDLAKQREDDLIKFVRLDQSKADRKMLETIIPKVETQKESIEKAIDQMLMVDNRMKKISSIVFGFDEAKGALKSLAEAEKPELARLTGVLSHLTAALRAAEGEAVISGVRCLSCNKPTVETEPLSFQTVGAARNRTDPVTDHTRLAILSAVERALNAPEMPQDNDVKMLTVRVGRATRMLGSDGAPYRTREDPSAVDGGAAIERLAAMPVMRIPRDRTLQVEAFAQKHTKEGGTTTRGAPSLKGNTTAASLRTAAADPYASSTSIAASPRVSSFHKTTPAHTFRIHLPVSYGEIQGKTTSQMMFRSAGGLMAPEGSPRAQLGLSQQGEGQPNGLIHSGASGPRSSRQLLSASRLPNLLSINPNSPQVPVSSPRHTNTPSRERKEDDLHGEPQGAPAPSAESTVGMGGFRVANRGRQSAPQNPDKTRHPTGSVRAKRAAAAAAIAAEGGS
uniref:Uncharacterized protein n=1 Tax=Chromera velia CCMP2878 TaxID=1169474 RepID=A0A0G4FFD6_9ALVE|eukprot:Cvel_16659.t1-p1 / transcript=Cvel_16659.t1 / gene=Cvel_16659 / organism=Chromera_velia_CCMP2878 / gene_product=hypothetical protein / transcript_product=hypothetical protein / location=Cvel_scaffold1292:25170-30389(-) / protein_length=652 / sequence_SO=supercontig / SO=protein_coding / is_pseudo=false